MKKRKKIFLAGTFDILHPGHVKLFEWIKKKFRGKLIVAIARDENVKKMKGKKPVFSEKERKKILGSIKFVDKVILGDKNDFFKPILREKPDIIILGYDQWAGEEEVKEKLKDMGIKAKVIRAPAFSPGKWKSSKILERIKANI